jgi:hypothetical protein
MQLKSSDNEPLMKSYCAYLCRQLNGERRSLHEVSAIKLYYMLETTAYDGQEGEPEKVLQYRHSCFPGVKEVELDW